MRRRSLSPVPRRSARTGGDVDRAHNASAVRPYWFEVGVIRE